MLDRTDALLPRRSATLSGLLAVAATLVACGDRAAPVAEVEAPAEPVQIARSADGVVVAAHPLAANAGSAMLEMGGNAADAAVAAAFALAVVEPTMSGLGGRIQVVGRTPGGEAFAIDGTTQAPFNYRTETAPQGRHGYVVVGIPGQVAGVLRLLDERGRLSRAEVMAPAIELATEGFELLPGEAARLNGVRDLLAESVGANRYFVRADGREWQAGDTLVQTDLAGTLTTIAAEGAASFYTGSIAEQIVTDMEVNSGFVTLDDLARYEALDPAIVTGSYRGYDLVGSDRPAGGATAIEALHIMENFDASGFSEADWASVLGQSLLLAFEDRYSPLPPEEEEAAVITSKEWAAQRAREVRLPTPATASADVPAPQSAPYVGSGDEPMVAAHWLAQEHTTHLSTADRDGMVIALTQSLGPAGGSRVATPGLGFLYAATIGGYLGPMEPAQRAASAITPFIMLQDGEVAYVLGAAGGVRILSAVVEVASRAVDGGLSFPEAMAAPRFFPGFAVRSDPVPWDFETSSVAAFDTTSVSALGLPTQFVERETSFGRVHGIAYDAATGEWEGVADPRWEGAAAVPRPSTLAQN